MSQEILVEEAAWKDQLQRPSEGRPSGLLKTPEVRVRRVFNSDRYLHLFEKSYEHSSLRRTLFFLFCGGVGYLHVGGAVLLAAFALTQDFCRLYVAVVPLLFLVIEMGILSLMCLVISVRLACRAEIFQVWRHVLTANLYAVVVSAILLVITMNAHRDLANDQITHWEITPCIFVLAFHLTTSILIRDEDTSANYTQIVVSACGLLMVLFYVLHITAGSSILPFFYMIPVCLLALIGLSFRCMALRYSGGKERPSAQQGSGPGLIARELLASLGYAALLVPALETVTTCTTAPESCGAQTLQNLSWVSATLAVPVAVGLLAPMWVYVFGTWAENVGFRFLAV